MSRVDEVDREAAPQVSSDWYQWTTMADLAASILFTIPVWWPLIVLLAVGLTVHAVTTVFGRRRQRVWTAWVEASAIAACVAMAVYGAGYFMGGFFYMDPEDPCMAHGYGYSVSAREPSSVWPLSNPLCTSDSGVVDLVPAFVNPAVYVAISLCVTCAVAAVAANRGLFRRGGNWLHQLGAR